MPNNKPDRFDYFKQVSAKLGQTDGLDDPPSDGQGASEFGRAAKQRWGRLFKLFFMGFCAWFAWQYHDVAAYSFRAAQAPHQLGDVTSFTPDVVEHNSYVCVDGISEHRGMTQKMARVLGQTASPYWFFRLAGSRGIFVEVPPDPQRFSTIQRMHVCGRAVDPSQSPSYKQLIAAYEALFATELASPTRLIQVDLLPGAHRIRYGTAIFGLIALLVMQAVALWRRRA